VEVVAGELAVCLVEELGCLVYQFVCVWVVADTYVLLCGVV